MYLGWPLALKRVVVENRVADWLLIGPKLLNVLLISEVVCGLLVGSGKPPRRIFDRTWTFQSYSVLVIDEPYGVAGNTGAWRLGWAI
ncbi:hypothetical protein KSS87_015766 [Heliosperma pusillum]|nr:hypothetical protein KSS87_015766 [Heliosperma pusillum]